VDSKTKKELKEIRIKKWIRSFLWPSKK
jgi:hypothetical protein